MAVTWPRLAPLGDRGLLVEFPPEVSPEINALVRGADAALAALPGVVETVPTFRSVLVVSAPLRVRFQELVERADACARAARPAPHASGAVVEIPVVYGGPDGPDLEAVAQAVGLTPDDVVRLHSQPTYLVYMLGFAPGYAYLGLLSPALRLPRRATPRLRVPAGRGGGLMTPVQDLGRRGWRRWGIPASGALDAGALRAANAAVGNHQAAAGLEVTFPGPRLRIVAETEIAVAGADLAAALHGAELAPAP